MAHIIPFPHLLGMGKSVSTWRVSRIAGSRAERLGAVEAGSAEEAIKLTIKKRQITDPLEQRRIVAMPDS